MVISPLCRHHHRKQAQGWRLERPEPGVLIWHIRSAASNAHILETGTQSYRLRTTKTTSRPKKPA